MGDSKPVPEFKVSVLGAGAVGKSALTIRFVTQNFLEEYDPTIEDSYRKEGICDGDSYILDILDTAGQEEFSSMQDHWMRARDGYLFVYSITARTTFEEVSVLYEKVLRTQEAKKVPAVICGNKCDLEESRQVNHQEGADLAKKLGTGFFETSAKNKINNEDCFLELVREVRKAKKPVTPLKKPGFKCIVL
jgi:GTPase KRas protein